MTTFEEARAIVAAQLAEVWRPEDGTLYVAADGFEDADYWHVVAGAREALIDGDADLVRLDAPAYLVDKSTGEIVLLDVIANFDRLGAMRPVAASPTT